MIEPDAELLAAGARFRDRERNPDFRGEGPRYVVEMDKGFQLPEILGEGDTPAEAFERALSVWARQPTPRKPSYEELETTVQTWQHIDVLRRILRVVAFNLLERGETHDRSKLDRSEVDIFTEYTPKLRQMSYGSDEYKQCLKEMGTALRHHYDHNLHHPESRRRNEEWRSIRGFEGHYEVSNFGDVRSLPRTLKREGPKGPLAVKGRMLRQNITPKGYCRVQLKAEGAPRNVLVHVLVAEAFIPNPKGAPHVNHRNGRKRDNQVSNLEWCSPSENLRHAYDTGIRTPNARYVVTCEDLGLSTIGCSQMEARLRELGHTQATSGGVWKAINEGSPYLGFTFTGSKFAQWMNSPLRHMNLVDLLEMFCDWSASARRHADGDVLTSIELNKKRFGMGETLTQIFLNTVRDYGPAMNAALGSQASGAKQ